MNAIIAPIAFLLFFAVAILGSAYAVYFRHVSADNAGTDTLDAIDARMAAIDAARRERERTAPLESDAPCALYLAGR